MSTKTRAAPACTVARLEELEEQLADDDSPQAERRREDNGKRLAQLRIELNAIDASLLADSEAELCAHLEAALETVAPAVREVHLLAAWRLCRHSEIAAALPAALMRVLDAPDDLALRSVS